MEAISHLEARVPIEGGEVEGTVIVPPEASGVVVFAHGSGSSRHSPRNQRVGDLLRHHGLGTFLFDLLTEREERLDAYTGALRFDIPFLAERLATVTRWVLEQPDLGGLKIGYFGSSTGAAAALVSAAQMGRAIHAVVSRGGRPDLAGDFLQQVSAPTLLIVGGADREVLDLNEAALEQIGGEKHLEIVPGATHLFEETGALDQVAELAAKWFDMSFRE